MTDFQSKTPVTIRASSFGSLFDCPARWIAIHLEKKRSPSNGKAALGTAIHAGTAVYDTERLESNCETHRGSVVAAAQAAVSSLENPTEDVLWDEDINKAKDIAASLTVKYCQQESHKHNFVAVEAKVEQMLIKDLGIILTGTTDRIELTNEGYGIRDIKTGKTAVSSDGKANTKGHAAQMGVYELIAGAAYGQSMDAPAEIIGLQTNLTPEKQRIGTGKIVGAKEVLIGNEQHTGLLEIAAEIVHGVRAPWGNPKSTMCTEVYCPNFNTCFWRK